VEFEYYFMAVIDALWIFQFLCLVLHRIGQRIDFTYEQCGLKSAPSAAGGHGLLHVAEG